MPTDPVPPIALVLANPENPSSNPATGTPTKADGTREENVKPQSDEISPQQGQSADPEPQQETKPGHARRPKE